MDKLRILHLFDCYLPETENWAYRMLKSIPESATILTAIRFNGKFHDKHFNIIRFPLNLYGYEKTWWGKALIAYLIRHALPFYLVHRLHTPDLIHAHFANTGYFFLKLKKMFRCPYVISLYGFDYLSLPSSNVRWTQKYRVLFEQVDFFLCEGQFGKNLLQTMGCAPEKIGIARLGIPVAEIPFFTRTKHRQNLRLLQIASLREKKGHLFTLQAFATALRACPNMHLTIVGDDSSDGTKEKVFAMIKKFGIQDKSTVIKSVAFENLHAFMKDFDVFIHPSCTTQDGDCEGGAPVVLLDAQATGLPVIATMHCDIPEVVVHESTGLLAPERDVEKISDFIVRFYAMGHEEYNSFSKKAREHVLQNYNAPVCGAALRHIYETLIERHLKKA